LAKPTRDDEMVVNDINDGGAGDSNP
jgi:hypothetical protein